MGEKIKLTAFSGLLIPILLSLLMGWGSLWIIGWFLIMTTAILGYYRNTIGCITGDMLGAMAELLESFLFLICSMDVIR